ncbi:MAG: dihydroneopterin aldolase [Hyphomicrobiaceae bacterium]
MSDTIIGAKTKRPPLHATGRRKVFVRELELMAHVGVYEVEHRYEQRLVVSIELDVADAYDGASDRLAEVLDYGTVVTSIQRIVESEHLNLLETLAERIATTWLDDPRVQAVRVRLEKPDILPGCRSVGIEIERKRSSR